MYSPKLLAKNNQLAHQYLAFGVVISWKLEREVHDNGLLGKGKMYSFYLDVGRIIGNFHFSVVPVGTLGVNISS